MSAEIAAPAATAAEATNSVPSADRATPAAASPDDSLLAELAAREQLRVICQQVARVPYILIAADLLIVWLCARENLLWVGIVWFVAGNALQVTRARWGRKVARHPPASPVDAIRRAAPLYGALGVVRAAIVAPLFAIPLDDTHYVLTMVLISMAAGGVSSVAGATRAYLMWGVPVFVALVAGWLWQASFEGVWIAALLILMFAVLTSYVRDQGRMMGRLARFAHEKDQLAASLRTERDRAQAASESKTRFFAAASHDLRQPLHALAINATTLELVSRKQSDPVVKELSQSINRALGQSNSLLEGLLDISRLDASAVKVRLEPIEAIGLLSAVRDEFAASAAQRGLALTVEGEGAPDGLWIASDSDLMMRILNNLVSNAIKFTSRGTVRLSARPGGAGRVLLAVADSGIGIAEAEHARVFEEFYQVGNPSRDRSHGLGLGLSIVQRATALLGIGVRLHSSLGQGTRIELDVPAGLAPHATPAPAGEDDAAQSPARVLPERVLVIDDEPEILQALAGLLPQWGCEVRCASGSGEALAVLDTGFAPQALLVDHRLQGETGPQVIERIRARIGPVPAVVITGDTAPDNLLLLDASGYRVLHKPVDGLQLEQALAEARQGPAQ